MYIKREDGEEYEGWNWEEKMEKNMKARKRRLRRIWRMYIRREDGEEYEGWNWEEKNMEKNMKDIYKKRKWSRIWRMYIRREDREEYEGCMRAGICRMHEEGGGGGNIDDRY